jgi:serine kinase of HPr protein (carbohydrate metabolism regulator)
METINIHASCVVLRHAGEAFGAPADCGVLLLGESGAGKSDLALRLIAQGAQLVADDRVELFVRDDVLWAHAPKTLAGLIEVRGVGILSLHFEPEARIGLVVQLVAREKMPRMPALEHYEPPSHLAVRTKPPLIRLAPFDHSAAAKIAAAAAAFANPPNKEEGKPK